MKDIAFTGVFRFIFTPLVDEFPGFGAVSYSLREKVSSCCFETDTVLFLHMNLYSDDLICFSAYRNIWISHLKLLVVTYQQYQGSMMQSRFALPLLYFFILSCKCMESLISSTEITYWCHSSKDECLRIAFIPRLQIPNGKSVDQ